MDMNEVHDLNKRSRADLVEICESLVNENATIRDELRFAHQKIAAFSRLSGSPSPHEFAAIILDGIPIKKTSTIRLVVLAEDFLGQKISTGCGEDWDQFSYLDTQVNEQLGGKNLLEIPDTSRIHNFIFDPEKTFPRSLYAFPLILSQEKIGFVWVADKQINAYKQVELLQLKKSVGESELALGFLAHFIQQKQMQEVLSAAFGALNEPLLLVDRVGAILFMNSVATSRLHIYPSTETDDSLIQIINDHLREGKEQFSVMVDGETWEASREKCDLAEVIKGGFWIYHFTNVSRRAAKEKYLATIIETLSTYINGEIEAMKGYAALTSGLGQLSSKQTEYLEKISTGADRVVQKLRDLLSVNRLKPEGFLNIEAFDLGLLVDETMALFSPLMVQKQLDVSVDYNDERINLHSDRLIIEQLILNLLESAVQDSPLRSTIKLAIQTDRGSVLISVRDQGTGISKPDLDTIERDSVIIGKYQNLQIIKAISELLLGKMTIDSQLGGGKQVTISLPEKY